MTTGQRIKSARKAAKMTQAELAFKMGVTNHCINKWETGVRNPKHNTLCRIADAIGVDVNCLLPVSRWISVNERTPSNLEDVLVVAYWHGKYQTFIGWYAEKNRMWNVNVGYEDKNNLHVTHWMPIPKPPTGV